MSTLKILIISALLSVAIVAAYGVTQSQAMIPTTGKLYSDRIVAEGPETMLNLRATDTVTAGLPEISSRLAGTTAKRGDLVRVAEQADCSRQAWPHIAPECITSEGAPARKVRTITVEKRDAAPNTSVLVRVPTTETTRR